LFKNLGSINCICFVCRCSFFKGLFLIIKDIHFTYLTYFTKLVTNTDLNYCNIKENLSRHKHIKINQLRYFFGFVQPVPKEQCKTAGV